MQQENPPFYENLTSHLSPEETSIIRSALDQAQANAQAAVQQAAQAAQAAHIPPSAVPNGGAS